MMSGCVTVIGPPPRAARELRDHLPVLPRTLPNRRDERHAVRRCGPDTRLGRPGRAHPFTVSPPVVGSAEARDAVSRPRAHDVVAEHFVLSPPTRCFSTSGRAVRGGVENDFGPCAAMSSRTGLSLTSPITHTLEAAAASWNSARSYTRDSCSSNMIKLRGSKPRSDGELRSVSSHPRPSHPVRPVAAGATRPASSLGRVRQASR